jgi:hypothetical protein
MRKIFDFDKICFKNCVGEPDKKFSAKQEACLSKINK